MESKGKIAHTTEIKLILSSSVHSRMFDKFSCIVLKQLNFLKNPLDVFEG